MPRPDKTAVVTMVRERIDSSSATMLTEYRGLTVAELATLRAELRKAGADYKVAKNTLVAIAAREAGLDVPAGLLTGPTAITFCGDDPVAAAKVLKAFAKDHPNLIVKGGILDGRMLDAGEALQLAELSSRDELLATLAGMFEAIVAQPARLALANLTKAVRLIAALQAKRAEEAPAAEQPAAEAPAAEQPATEEAPAAKEPAAPAAAEQPGEPTTREQPLSGEAADAPDAPATKTTTPAE